MGYKHQLNKSNELKDVRHYITYDIETDGETNIHVIPLVSQDILDVQLVWDIFTNYAHGSLVFYDKTNMLSTIVIDSTMQYRIEATDKNDVFFSHSFDIVSYINEYNYDAKSSIRIDFIDPFYSYFNSLHISKGYNNIRVDEIISDVLSLAPFTIDKNTKFSKTKTTYKNFVIPGHRNFANFIANRENLDGFSFIQARRNIHIVNPEDLINPRVIDDCTQLPDGRKIIFINMQPDHQLAPYQVKTLKRLYANTLVTTQALPNVMEYKFDYSTKMMKENVNVKSKSINTFRKNVADNKQTILPELINTIGVKQSEVPNEYQNDKFYTFRLLENSKYEITTDGSFNLDILQVVGLSKTLNIKDYKIMDHLSNGLYYIIKIVDKFQGNNFNQIVTLGRSGYINAAKRQR
jgi:hypothetical protein